MLLNVDQLKLTMILFFKGYLHIENNLKMAMQKYKPTILAYILVKKKILSSVNYYILTTLKKVSSSYQSSVLLELLKRDIQYLPKYRELIQLVKTKKSLRHIYYSTRSDIGLKLIK